jgi:hypothetical protein
MSEDELTLVVRKKQKLNELQRARNRVRQLERELRGEPEKPEESVFVPEFLRPPLVSDRAKAESQSRLPMFNAVRRLTCSHRSLLVINSVRYIT